MWSRTFEYTNIWRSNIVRKGDLPLVDWLNEKGRTGWQLCAIEPASDGKVYYFKREFRVCFGRNIDAS